MVTNHHLENDLKTNLDIKISLLAFEIPLEYILY